MKPMKIKRYIRWKRDVAAAQKRVARAKAIFEDAMKAHPQKYPCKITKEQVVRLATVFLKEPDTIPMPWQPAPGMVQAMIPNGIDPFKDLRRKSVKVNFGEIRVSLISL